MYELGVSKFHCTVGDSNPCIYIIVLEHNYSDSSNLIGHSKVSYFHSDTDEGTTCSALALSTCSALALRACSSWAQLL